MNEHSYNLIKGYGEKFNKLFLAVKNKKMICILILMTFAILGLFSAKYRVVYKEALTCIKNKIKGLHCPNYTLWKTKALNKFEDYPKLSVFIGRHFDKITNTLVILMFLLFIFSGFFVGNGIYNYAVYGNCNGPNNEDFCIFNPLAEEGCECGLENCTAKHESVPCESCECTESACEQNS